jgi:gluconolactonase
MLKTTGVGLAMVSAFVAATATLICQAAAAQAPPAAPVLPVVAPVLPPSRVVDLTTADGMATFAGQWKNTDAKIIEVPAMPNAGAAWKTAYDVQPKAGDASFDDSAWATIDPKGLLDRRGGGHLFMTWFRSNLTVPAKIGDFDTAGARIVLSIIIDDYAEVWVNGQMPRAIGRPSPATIQGFNMPNRVMLSESVKPGDRFQIAILGINGPISLSPANPVFFREAKIEFFK